MRHGRIRAAEARRRRGRRVAVGVLAFGLGLLPLSLLGSDDRLEIEFESSAGRVVFPHLFHAEELGVECGECHHETMAAELELPHPEIFVDVWRNCEECHRAGEARMEPQGCKACHAAGGDAADETLSAKVVVHRTCWECHEIGTGQEASRGCGLCHEDDNES